jgi:hypothetical protein
MYSVNLSEKLKRFTFKISVVFLASLFVVVLGPNLLELEGSQALAKKKKGGRYCTATAKAAYKACLNEIKDDYNIAVGNCINVSDSEDREDCFNEAKNGEDGYKAAKEECKDQYEARREVCGDLGEDRYDPDLSPGQFVENPLDIGTGVTANPYWPLVPGTTWTYENTFAGETITVEVLNEIKVIEYPADSGQEFNCIVVNDVVTDTSTSEPIEDTLDWYAQDLEGNVWYFGEIAQNFEDGELVDIEGSWKAGVDGAKPGILMWAYPDGADSEPQQEVYRQEFFLGDAEDIGEFVEFVDSITVRDTIYTDVLKTKDYTPIEPDVGEFKYYAPGVGLILEVAYEDDEELTGETVELDSFVAGP